MVDQSNIRREGSTTQKHKRTRKMRPYPVYTLERALAVPIAIQEFNSGLAFDRELLASTLGTTPGSSRYTMWLNSSAGYGLTKGAYNEDRISLTARGEAIVAPTGADERLAALKKAALHPELFGRFFDLLDGKRMPDDTYAINMLQREFGVSPSLSSECLEIAKANAKYADFLRNGIVTIGSNLNENSNSSLKLLQNQDTDPESEPSEPPVPYSQISADLSKIFIGHIGDSPSVGLVKDMLDELDIPYVTVDISNNLNYQQPVSSLVVQEMQGCSAAILLISGGVPRVSLEKSLDLMLCQLGAALFLYGDRCLVLSDDKASLGARKNIVDPIEVNLENAAESTLILLRALLSKRILKVSMDFS